MAKPSLTSGFLALFLFAGCSSAPSEGPDGGSPSGGNGGSVPGTGGMAPGTGGSAGSGGAPSTGGATASGGVPTTGGATSSGGAPSTGGADAIGGSLTTGGSPSTGGAATGGQDGSGGGTGGGTVLPPFARGPVQTCSPPASLKLAGECNDLLIGTAVTPARFSESGFTNAAKEFNFATPENEMKWDQLEPQQNQFNFSAGDQVVNFAMQNGMQVKGHTLVWHMQLPGWVENLNSPEAVRSAMVNHIKKVMEHYKGKVLVWDVVNEATDIDDKATGSGNPRYRDTVFYRHLGETYLDEAFFAAKEADPDAKLFYNDFGGDGLNEKSDMIYELVKGLVERGVPIDGVGMQAHMGKPNPVPPAADIATNFQRIADLGLEIQVSELDINGCDPNVSVAVQEQAYHDMVAACVNQPFCTAVTVWGISDKYSWVNSFDEAGCNGQSGRALMWDDNYQKKSTYDAMLQALIGN